MADGGAYSLPPIGRKIQVLVERLRVADEQREVTDMRLAVTKKMRDTMRDEKKSELKMKNELRRERAANNRLNREQQGCSLVTELRKECSSVYFRQSSRAPKDAVSLPMLHLAGSNVLTAAKLPPIGRTSTLMGSKSSDSREIREMLMQPLPSLPAYLS